MATEMIEKAMPTNAYLVTVSDVRLQESAFQGSPFHWKGPVPSAIYWPLLTDCRIWVSVQHCWHSSRELLQYSRAITLSVTSVVSWMPVRNILVSKYAVNRTALLIVQ